MQVAHDEVVDVLRELLEGGPTALDDVDDDDVALTRRSQLDQLAHVWVVVDDEDSGHASSLPTGE
jgi:hypothetical protein